MNQIINARLRGRDGLFSIEWADGLIRAIDAQPGQHPATAEALDAGGMLVIPPLVEPHIHLDAALTAGEPRWNLSGTLFEGIERWAERKARVTPEDTKARAHRTLRMLAAHGIQHVRSHVDVTEPGLGTLKAMLEVRDEARGLIDLQLVAFPQEGIESFANGRALMTEAVEMGVDDHNKEAILDRLRTDTAASRYPQRFAAAYPGEARPLNWANIIKAIASFQRTLISGNSRYDQWLGGQATLTAAETRGMNLFFGERAECFHCHGSFNFNDQIEHAASRLVETPFHNTGLYNLGGRDAFPEPNRGVFELTAKADDMGKFRAPSLRNVEVTAPYMHDGTIATLEDVLRFYAAGGRHITSGPFAGDGRANRLKSDLVTRIDLNDQEQADLVAFLKTLTDHDFLTHPRHANPFPSP